MIIVFVLGDHEVACESTNEYIKLHISFHRIEWLFYWQHFYQGREIMLVFILKDTFVNVLYEQKDKVY